MALRSANGFFRTSSPLSISRSNAQAVARLSFRALVRSPERAESLRKLGVKLIEGNFADWNSWKRALDGVAAVFNIIVTHRDAVRWNNVFLDCAKQSGVRHVVQLSGMSVSPKSPAEFHRQMSQCDEALTASGLSHTILRPNVFYQNMLRFAGSIQERVAFGQQPAMPASA